MFIISTYVHNKPKPVAEHLDLEDDYFVSLYFFLVKLSFELQDFTAIKISSSCYVLL